MVAAVEFLDVEYQCDCPPLCVILGYSIRDFSLQIGGTVTVDVYVNGVLKSSKTGGTDNSQTDALLVCYDDVVSFEVTENTGIGGSQAAIMSLYDYDWNCDYIDSVTYSWHTDNKTQHTFYDFCDGGSLDERGETYSIGITMAPEEDWPCPSDCVGGCRTDVRVSWSNCPTPTGAVDVVGMSFECCLDTLEEEEG